MLYVNLVLRVLHILAGMFWAGGTIVFAWFIEPNASALGPAGIPFTQRLAASSGFPKWISLSAAVSTLAGAWLLWQSSAGFSAGWFSTGFGLSITLGAITGISAALIGMLVQTPASARLGRLSRAVAQAGGPPTQDQSLEIGLAQRRLRLGGRITAVLLVLTVVFMAAARYMLF
jgi:uncharacterized membrane protein